MGSTNEPRDYHGRWSSGTSGGVRALIRNAAEKVQGFVMKSAWDRQEQSKGVKPGHNVAEASARLKDLRAKNELTAAFGKHVQSLDRVARRTATHDTVQKIAAQGSRGKAIRSMSTAAKRGY